MPTRPSSPDPSNATGDAAASAFGGLGAAGLSFFQDWMKAAGSALPHVQGAQGAAIKGAAPWSLPTLDPDELDKRIQDLRTVQFWLEQNARLIAMTIQGLEVQRMTLTTLRGMNVSMDAVRDSLKARAATSSASPAPEAEDPPAAAAAAATPESDTGEPTVNPLRWWDTLTQQFSNLATQAVQVAQASAQGMEAAASANTPAPPAAPDAPGEQAEPSASSRARPVPRAASTQVPVRKTASPPSAGARKRTPGGGSAG